MKKSRYKCTFNARPVLNIMLDSGAYSAWTKKSEIDIDDYISFIKGHESDITAYVNLDVIPGDYGRKPSQKEVEASAAKGFENMLYMRGKGLDPVHVFHQGEDFKWLEKMIAEGCEYIGISPANDRTSPEKKVWLDSVFHVITDEEGYPIVKTHGFGITATWSTVRYPWYSVDSVTYKLQAGFGKIYVPRFGADGVTYDYARNPFITAISDSSNKIEQVGQHYGNVNSFAKQALSTYCESKGFTIKELADRSQNRRAINAIYYQDVVDNVPVGVYADRSAGFFKRPKIKKDRVDPWNKIIFYFGVGGHSEVKYLHKLVDPSILISYEAVPKTIKTNYFTKFDRVKESK